MFIAIVAVGDSSRQSQVSKDFFFRFHSMGTFGTCVVFLKLWADLRL